MERGKVGNTELAKLGEGVTETKQGCKNRVINTEEFFEKKGEKKQRRV